ncbi:MAG: YbhB/YbcL family Raf kinase inhibitor-like protein [Patescibacteria group bacterium]|nr:YbhB/YbcL family Raf kinase inhibitor-like protein [Patescibacteria group bacterium]MDE2590348.1 YbhB/YbcL family Raf kinase inhibitor-like protein [Patescibacteria group bacterium]
MHLTSSVFVNNGTIPSKYTCDGENVNPPLAIEDVPVTAKSLALIVDDPDAPMGTWVHWVAFNIPPTLQTIQENSIPSGVQSETSFGKLGYGGPCPPSGVHHYHFKLYALDTMLSLDQSAKKSDVVHAMQEHILAQTELVGLYSRK